MKDVCKEFLVVVICVERREVRWRTGMRGAEGDKGRREGEVEGGLQERVWRRAIG
jgi:hypothetical protein